MSSDALPASKPETSPVGFNLIAIALVVALCGLALAYLLDAASRSYGRPAVADPQVTLTRTLGGRDLAIPQSWFRYEEQKDTGFAKQIDLQLALPLGPEGAVLPIDITLLPRSRVRPSAGLLDGVYLHQFAPAQLSGPEGLVGKPLLGGEGFETESVWYDPLSASPFVAKCSAPVAEGAAARCLRTVYLGPGIAAVYAFDQAALGHWRRFDAEVGARLRQIGAL